MSVPASARSSARPAISAGLPDASKILLSFAMIAGRLEIQGVLILFLPSFYL